MSRYRPLDDDHPTSNRATRAPADEPSRGGRGSSHGAHWEQPAVDVREVFSRSLDLPRSDIRERVHLKDRTYELKASEVRALATIGAFRVVDVRDLDTGSRDARTGDLAHLRNLKLIDVSAPQFRDGERAALVTLTHEGKALLDHHRSSQSHANGAAQAYYAGLAKPREARHDAQLYRSYLDAAARLQNNGARIQRVLLDYELKRDYQRFLQASNRGAHDSSGRPDRTPDELNDWAASHHLPIHDGHVQFPDVRIEYEHPDGRRDHQDIELTTEHYSARHMAGRRASGFTLVRAAASSRRGGKPFDPHNAERTLK